MSFEEKEADDDDEVSEEDIKQIRIKRMSQRTKDKKFEKERPLKPLRKKPFRPNRIEYDPDADYSHLEEES